MTDEKVLSRHMFRRTARKRADYLNRLARRIREWLASEGHDSIAEAAVRTGDDVPDWVLRDGRKLITARTFHTNDHFEESRKRGLRWVVVARPHSGHGEA